MNEKQKKRSTSSGCLKAILVVLVLAGLLIVAGVIFIADVFNSGSYKRKEVLENWKLSWEKLPEKYEAYQYLEDLQSTDKYEVIDLKHDYYSYTVLPDSGLVLKAKGFTCIIDKDGYITDSIFNVMSLYGTSLMKYNAKYIVDLESDTMRYIMTGTYCNWVTTGDTTSYPIRPISEIASTKAEFDKAYNRADIVMKTDKYTMSPYLLYINQVWYFTNTMGDIPEKESKTKSPKIDALRNREGLRCQYKQRTKYNRTRSSMFGGYTRSSWNLDAYMKLNIGNTKVLFKQNYYAADPDDLNIYLINRKNYAIVDENYLIRIKR